MADTTFHSITLPGTDPAKIPDIAAEFNTDTVYDIRDYCTYQGILYRCIIFHEAGEWDSTHFIATNLDNEFDSKLRIPLYQNTAPLNPKVGDLWIDSEENSEFYNIDPLPTNGSTNAVQSGGTKIVLDTLDLQKANRNLLTGDYSSSAIYEVNQLVLAAPETFSTTIPYSINDLCIHNGIIYKCTTSHQGAWNASHFSVEGTANTDTLYRCVERIRVPEEWTPSHWQSTNFNTELARIRENEADTSMIAENFGDSNSYTIGNYVVYNGNLFKCIQNVIDTQSWDPDYWVQVALASEVNNLICNEQSNGTYTLKCVINNGIKQYNWVRDN